MSKIHYFQRYSSAENTITNNTLQLVARIYEFSASRASRFLTDVTGESIEIGIEISQQKPGPHSIPDGRIIQRSFEILIESKVDQQIDQGQLVRHAEGFSEVSSVSREPKRILLLLTKQKIDREVKRKLSERIKETCQRVIFCNVTYEMICTALDGLFEGYENEMQALSDDYVDYCHETGLVDQSRFLMRMVPCGKSFDINREHGIYFDPSDRGYRRHDYVGIYKDKAVRVLWKIDSVFDIDYDGSRLDKTLIQGRDTDEYDRKLNLTNS